MYERFDGLSSTCLKVEKDGSVPRAVAYLRVSARGGRRAAALIEHQNALQRFAEEAGYDVVGWHVENEGVELAGAALDRLLEAVAEDGREYNAVLVWSYSPLSRNPVRVGELRKRLEALGVELVTVADRQSVAHLERQLGEMAGSFDDEVAG